MRAALAIPNAAQARPLKEGFTLIEVLVTLLLIGIVIPAIMHAITAAAAAGNAARHRDDAASLAKSQMASLILAVSQGQNPVLAADAAQNGYQYHWKATVQPWNQDTTTMGIQEIDLAVSWADGRRSESVTLCSLAYNREAQQ
ncbi:MAG: prepilin-type N-terminal cleavage/methylation domain-containing protein [Tepidisphaeraceae bacterium]|jgi:type II secretion system protein I